jgi:hypothetical protein
MSAAPICITCNLERTLISIKPAKNRHDVLQYECANCGNIFRLVMQREPLALDDLVFEEPAGQAATR